jgi:hypothetical protein
LKRQEVERVEHIECKGAYWLGLTCWEQSCAEKLCAMVRPSGGHVAPAALNVDRMDAVCVDHGEIFQCFSQNSARISTMAEAKLDTERIQ